MLAVLKCKLLKGNIENALIRKLNNTRSNRNLPLFISELNKLHHSQKEPSKFSPPYKGTANVCMRRCSLKCVLKKIRIKKIIKEI